jgi:hypothetical protein
MDIFLLADTSNGYTFLNILQVILIPVILSLAAILIPQRWQTRQRDFETKTKLVSEISEQVMSTVMTLFIDRNDPIEGTATFRSKEIENAFKKWKIETCVTGSKIHAYFVSDKKKKPLHLRWREFSKQVDDYYMRWQRSYDASELKKWEKDKDELFREKARIIALILAADINGFEASDPDLWETGDGKKKTLKNRYL